MKLPSTTYHPVYLDAIGFTCPSHGQQTRFMYWAELLKSYRKDALLLVFPLAYRSCEQEVPLLAELIMAKDDEVKVAFMNSLTCGLSWVVPLLLEWWPDLNAVTNCSSPPSAHSEVNATAAIALALSFNGKGMKFAVARYLAPGFVSPVVASPEPFYNFTDFADIIITAHPDMEKTLREVVRDNFACYSHLLPSPSKCSTNANPDLIPSV